MDDLFMEDQFDNAGYTSPAIDADGMIEVLDDMPDDGYTPFDEGDDPVALLDTAFHQAQAMEAELARTRAEADRMRQVQQQAAAAALQQQWQQEQQRVLKQAESLEPEVALRAVSTYYQNQMNNLSSQYQSLAMQQNVERFAELVMREHGLSGEDRDLLGGDPYKMPQIAARLAQKNAAAYAAEQAQQRVQQNADRIGGSRGGRQTRKVQAGSTDHLKALLGV